MKRLFWLLLFAIVSGPALADTDFACMKGCLGGGGNYVSCTPVCSYTPAGTVQEEWELLPELQPVMNLTCFKKCHDAGMKPAECVPQCTQAGTGTPPVAVRKNAKGNRLFEPPAPVKGVLLDAPDSHSALESTTDYGCLTICVKGGLQYELCSQRCRQ